MKRITICILLILSLMAAGCAYQDKLQQCLLEHKVTVVTRGDGTEKLTEQVLITSKGMTRLAELLNPSPLRLVAGGSK